MKSFSLLVVVAAALATAKTEDHDHTEAFKQAENECATEKNISLEVLAQTEKGIFQDNDNLNCFAECMFKKVGFLKDDSPELQIEVMKTAARTRGGDKHAEIAEICAKKTGTDLCDTTYLVYRCFFEELAKPENA